MSLVILGESKKTIQLSSAAFVDGDPMPERCTAAGGSVSPPLGWSEVPEDAQELALVCEDLDAGPGPRVHWIVYKIQIGNVDMPEGSTRRALRGANDFGIPGYTGPRRRPGAEHRFRFRLYALDQHLELQPGVAYERFAEAIEGLVLAHGEIVGLS